MYKMVPVTPEVYSALEKLRDASGFASFNDLLRRVVFPSRPKSMLGSLKGEKWLRGFKREKVDRF